MFMVIAVMWPWLEEDLRWFEQLDRDRELYVNDDSDDTDESDDIDDEDDSSITEGESRHTAHGAFHKRRPHKRGDGESGRSDEKVDICGEGGGGWQAKADVYKVAIGSEIIHYENPHFCVAYAPNIFCFLALKCEPKST